MTRPGMTTQERRAASALAAIFGLRMVGLFMVLPVLALHVEELSGATPLLVGLAVGVYGLTQAFLQVPFGMASDRLGRKPVITAGLLLFAAGSVLAAVADTIHGVILGRALQGSGAIAAVVMALLADLTREEHRTKAMATIGVTIGMSFVVAMVAGPALGGAIGVRGIFWLIAGLALAAIGLLYALVPTPARSTFHREAEAVPDQFGRVLRDGQLLRLDFGIFALHLMLTASFVVLPIALRDAAGLAAERHWLVYLPVMVLAMGAAVPFIIVAEKKRRMKGVFLGAIATLGVAELGIVAFHGSLLPLALLLWVFFTAFTLLEATLPSLLSKQAPADAKGTAMGVYSSSQFLGAFAGGAAGGWLYGAGGFAAVFGFCALAAAAWLGWAAGMRPPRYLESHMVHVEPGVEEAALAARLAEVAGVVEVAVHVDEGVAYLKVERDRLDEVALERCAAGHGDTAVVGADA